MLGGGHCGEGSDLLNQWQTGSSVVEASQSWSSRTDALEAALSFPPSQGAAAEVAEEGAGRQGRLASCPSHSFPTD